MANLIPAYAIQAKEMTRSQTLSAARGLLQVDKSGCHNAQGFLTLLGVPYDSIDKAWINTERQHVDLLITKDGEQRPSFMPLYGLYAPTWDVAPYPVAEDEGEIEIEEDE